MPHGYHRAQRLVPCDEDSNGLYEGPGERRDGRPVHGRRCLVVCALGASIVHDDPDGNNTLPAEAETMCRDLSLASEARIGSKKESSSLSRPSETQTLSASQHSKPSAIAGPSTATEQSMIDVLEKRRGTGLVFPTEFIPPSSTIKPTELFLGKATYARLTRYIHRSDPRCILIFTDGACLNNGKANPRAGWALVHGPGFTGQPAQVASGRLENKGPYGDAGIQSNNRAELRAVIAALRLRHWTVEGFNNIVIATDSEYVAIGATQWVKAWVKNGWRTSGKEEVKNKDLWEALLGEVERWQAEGLSIQFWRIRREWNKDADAAAKKAAQEPEA
ncbi:ribonuclease H-like protein [Xylaria bambusicola]|uniref:ribonuclease H-like protein n=1 Tax=Xylaria bambusicola TaxID=326684 RepID=UPI002008BBAC|nr:ribonuclease H-like protein [Xylaria bambusicola]KAI0517464.1 ribonuclease H-like protein [Xylaria bambusicola]